MPRIKRQKNTHAAWLFRVRKRVEHDRKHGIPPLPGMTIGDVLRDKARRKRHP